MPSPARSYFLFPLLVVAACAVLYGLSQRESNRHRTVAAPADRTKVAHQLLRALADVDYRAFVAPAGGHLKKLPENAFLQLAVQHGARLRHGYELLPLDTNLRREVEMTRWRVVFTSGGRDATLTLGTSGGTVRLFTLW
jgi:hypothetical protein